MKQLWDEIAAYLKHHAPHRHAEMIKPDIGATAEQIAELESAVGKPLPDDFREFLALCNESGAVEFFGYECHDIASMIRRREGMNKLCAGGTWNDVAPESIYEGGPLEFAWWHSGWLPFAEDSGGNMICIDFDPAPAGDFGQVFYWERVEGPCKPTAKSFTEFVRRFRDDLISGISSYDDETGFFRL